jgi:hypothetical protein
MSGSAKHPHNVLLKNPPSTQAAGVVLPAGVDTVASAWGANQNHAWQHSFMVAVVNNGLNPITQIVIQQNQGLPGGDYLITDAVPLPVGESRWYRMEPTPPYLQVRATSAVGSTCDVLFSETYAIA